MVASLTGVSRESEREGETWREREREREREIENEWVRQRVFGVCYQLSQSGGVTTCCLKCASNAALSSGSGSGAGDGAGGAGGMIYLLGACDLVFGDFIRTSFK